MKYINSIVLRNLGIPVIRDFSDLSLRLSISNRKLYLLTQKKEYFYHSIIIPKKNGKYRELQVPSFSMKVVQRWIYEEILKKIKVSNETMAFVPGKNGILDSSKLHCKSSYLMEMDLHNFFGTINEKRIWKLFLNLGYNTQVAYLLTEICTYNGCLPQGAVTSPYLANLICYNMDSRISGICRKNGVLYSRYADDLCFSSDNRRILNRLKDRIIKIIEDEQFILNNEKTRFLSEQSRKDILGLTVNGGKIRVNKQYKKIIRAKVYNAISGCDYSEKVNIEGMISYVDTIENGYKVKMRMYIDSIIKRFKEQGDAEKVSYYNNMGFRF